MIKNLSTWQLFIYLNLLDFVHRNVKTNSLRNRNKMNTRLLRHFKSINSNVVIET